MTKNNFDEMLANFQAAVLDMDVGGVRMLDETIATLMRQPDPRCIEPLLLALDDHVKQDEGMFSIIHAAESFDDDRYIEALLVVLPKLREKAPKWASIVLMRVLNNAQTMLVLTRKLRVAETRVKEAVEWLCERINERSPSFVKKTLPVLLAAK